jgi:hypothetical protein
MKTKFILAIVILTLVISACAPALPAATATPVAASPTASATATAAPTATRTPRSTQTSIPLSAEEQLWQLVISTQDYTYKDGLNDLTSLLIDEYVARFPEGSHINLALHPEMVMLNYHADLEYTQGICQLLTNALNTLQPQIDRFTLDDVLNDILQKELGFPHTVVSLVLPADNLFGDGQMSWGIIVQVQENPGYPLYDLLLAFEQDLSGKYRVTAPSGSWNQLFGISSTFSPTYHIYDTNKNGIPELAFEDYSTRQGASGPWYCDLHFSLMEWNGTEFVNLIPSASIFGVYDTCGSADIRENQFGADEIIFPVSSGNGCGGEEWVAFSAVVTDYVYTWNGITYQFSGKEIRNFSQGRLASEPLCRFNYANETGVRYPLSVATLEEFASGSPLTRLSERLGEAYQDYFKFKLGTWYAMRGDSAKAIDLLTQVADHPQYPQYQVASNLAKAYLNAYRDSGSLFKACEAANSFLANERIPANQDYSNVTDRIIQAWGFSDGWILSEYDLPEDSSRSVAVSNVCRIEDAITLSLTGKPVQSMAQIQTLLDKNQIPYLDLAENDADRDGDLDYVIMIDTQGRMKQMWLLENNLGQIMPVFINEYEANEGSSFDWQTINLPENGSLANIIHYQNILAVFQITRRYDQDFARILLSDSYRVSDYLLETGLENHSFQIVIKNEDGDEIYSWNPQKETFIRSTSSAGDFSDLIRPISQSLFQDKDYSKAYNLSKDALAALDAEVCEPNQSCHIIIAELLYRMGVAAELDGSRAESNLAYQRIITEFSDTAYADIAAQRMQP